MIPHFRLSRFSPAAGLRRRAAEEGARRTGTAWAAMKLAAAALLTMSALIAQPRVVTTGLQAPQKVALTPRGGLLVTETSMSPNSGRLSYIQTGGTRRTLLDALPSGVDVVGGPSGPTAIALRDGRTLYLAIGAGDAERRNDRGQVLHNPNGISSPLLSSVLAIRFSQEMDNIAGTFAMTAAAQEAIADGEEVALNDGSGSEVRISMLWNVPDAIRDGSGYRFANPWGLDLSSDGRTLWFIDASLNALYRIDTGTGRAQHVFTFAPAANPQAPLGPPVSEAVPTTVRVYGDQLLVSLLHGFPFTPGQARVAVVDPAFKTAVPFVTGLTSAIDIVWRDGGQRPQFFVLEFSANQFLDPALPGRLWRYDTAGPPVAMAGDLRAPVSLAIDKANGLLYVLELSGRLLEFRL